MPSRGWRNYPQLYRREAAKCTKCGKIFYPPRIICDKCGHREFETVALGETGKLITYTIIRTPSSAYSKQAPFALGIVEMDEGVKVMAQIADVEFDELKVGLPMRMQFRMLYSEGDNGVIHYGHKAVPERS